MVSAAEKVFSTPELLMEILSGLDMRTLLLSQRVSKQWQYIIAKTRVLQRALFFEPITATSDAKLVRDRELNPLLREVFPPFFRENERYEFGSYNGLHELMVGANARPFSFMDSGGNPNRRRAFLRAGASWRRMLVQQPAALKIGFIEREGHSQMSYSNACIPEPGGVRMGALYDLVYQFMGIQEAADSGNNAFGVYWREPEHDPRVTEWSRSCGQEELALEDLDKDVVVVVLRYVNGESKWGISTPMRKSLLRSKYRPNEWESKRADLKFINSQDWFG